jgi:arylsulfatase A-like enzyme
VKYQAGPFDQWPVGMGFDYVYGFVGGDTSQWQPNLYRGWTPIYPYVGHPKWNLTTAMADDAIAHIKTLHETTADKPFFVHYTPGGTHAPHHPTPEWIEKFKGKFSMGWNALREQIFANQKKLGVIPQDAVLTSWPAELKQWDALSADERKLFERQVEMYAAYLAYTDYEIGRVIQAVEDLGQLDNTLIIYISGDNGSSAEGLPIGTLTEVALFNSVEVPVVDQLKYFYDAWGSDQTYNHMAVGWTWAFDTPYRWTKQVASHFGGTRNGMAIAWRNRIKDAGGVRTRFRHVIDVVPTILEATGVAAPSTVDGIAQKPIEGVSMVYTFDKANAGAPSAHTTQYFEMFGNHGIYHEGWYANTRPISPPWALGATPPTDVVNAYQWELYDLTKDWTQSNDLAASNPAKLKEMQALFMAEAAKYQMLPLDNSLASRMVAPKPSLAAGRTQFTYIRPLTGIPVGDAPQLKLAQQGLRYTDFHSASLCSPTRAALITGRNHHSAHFGIVAEGSTGFPGYDSIVKKDTATIGTILRDNGYGTSWFGKNHNVSGWLHTQAGPFDQWPVGMGFEYFYGFRGGDASQWQPNLNRNTTMIAPYEGKSGWNLITAMADEAIDYMNRLNAVAPDKPFLVYYAPGATHAPHHPTKEWIDKFKGKFDHGWNKERERIFANQKRVDWRGHSKAERESLVRRKMGRTGACSLGSPFRM